MKPATALIAVSLAANLALCGVLVFKPSLAPTAFQDYFARRGGSTAPLSTAAATSSAAHRDAASAKPGGSAQARTALWSTFPTGDLRALIAHLQAAGFPIWAIRAILQVQLSEIYNPRLMALRNPDSNQPYWKSTSALRMDSATMQEYSKLARERSRVMRELLGEFSMRDDGDLTTAQRRNYGFLPKDKISAIERINEDYAEMTQQVRAAMAGVTLPEDREKLALLEREKRADLAALLGPADFAEYEMRNSPVTQRLRQQLTLMNATEEEFRAIYKINQPFAEIMNPTDVVSARESARLRAESQKQITDQLKATLGDARYAEYVRAGDREYQQLVQIAEREKLSSSAVTQAYDLRNQISAESNRIATDASMTDDSKRAALQTLSQNARSQFVATLGPTGGAAYVRQAENWLSQLTNGRSVTFNENGGMSFRGVGAGPGGAGTLNVIGGGAGGGGGGTVIIRDSATSSRIIQMVPGISTVPAPAPPPAPAPAARN